MLRLQRRAAQSAPYAGGTSGPEGDRSRAASLPTLHDAPLGKPVVLGDPGCPTALRLRLAELGLRCGECVCARQRTPGGGRVVEVGDTRIALDRATCRQLLLATRGPRETDATRAASR